jgi:DNA-binding MarR family transcriptional regulator
MKNADLYERVDRLNLILPQIIKRFHAVPSRPHSTPAMSVPQLRMLLLLDTEGGSTMGELARRASVTMPTATSSINALVSGRYVSRRRSPTDRRVVLVSLTARGREVLERFRAERRERLAAIFGKIHAADQARFVEAFETILDVLRKLDEAADA